jgi:ketosteroid isomerase-like protein
MDPKHRQELLEKVQTAAGHQAVLHSAYSAVAHGKFDEFATFLTDDVRLSISGFAPMDGVWNGRDAVAAATRRNFGMVDAQKPAIEHIVAQDDTVVALLREHGTFKSDGRAYSVRAVQWFTFQNGKISAIDEIVAPSTD